MQPNSTSPAAPSNSDPKRGPLELLVIQPTPFCNINCSYCYLPNRQVTKKISLETIDRIFFRVFESGLVRAPFTVLWHAGEPLTMPISFYEEAFKIARKYDPKGDLFVHALQTNATLITPEWCEFIRRHRMVIGVSTDGPQFLHDRNRVTRSGVGTHDKMVRGMRLLRKFGVPFSAIAVLTNESLDYPDEIYDYLCAEGIQGIALNIESIDGVNEKSSLLFEGVRARYAAFLSRLFDLIHSGKTSIWVREIDGIWGALAQTKAVKPKNQSVNPLAVVCFDVDGNFSGYSPELLGMKNEQYNNFTFGSVNAPIQAAVDTANFRAMETAIAAGVERCRETCSYFNYCGGGAPSNKIYENGTFDSTETLFCRLSTQTKIDVIRRKIEERAPFTGKSR